MTCEVCGVGGLIWANPFKTMPNEVVCDKCKEAMSKKLEPGMWCKPRNEQEWRAVLNLAEALGLLYHQPSQGSYLFDGFPDIVFHKWVSQSTTEHLDMPELSVPEFIAVMYEEAERRKTHDILSAVPKHVYAKEHMDVSSAIWSEKPFLDAEFLKSLPHVKPNWKRWVREKFKKYGKRIAEHEQRIKALEAQMLEKVSILDHAFEVDKMLKGRIEALEASKNPDFSRREKLCRVATGDFMLTFDPKASPKGIPFSVALEYLKAGREVRRKDWQPSTLRVQPRGPGGVGGMCMVFGASLVQGDFIPSLTDLLADDWEVIPEQP